jgi:hypothetical protein
MNWWDFVNVLLFLLAQHTVRFFFLSNIIMIFICTVIFIDMFVCVRLLSDMMVVDGVFVFYRYYSANGKMENCTSFFSFLFFSFCERLLLLLLLFCCCSSPPVFNIVE